MRILWQVAKRQRVSSEPPETIDLNSIDREYHSRSWTTIFIVSFCFIWATMAICFAIYAANDSADSDSRMMRPIFAVAGLVVLGVGGYMINTYRFSRYVLSGGELRHFGAGNTLRFTLQLSEITSVKIDFSSEGHGCRVEYGGDKSFQFTNSIKNHKEFADLVKAISDQNWRTSRENAPWISDPLTSAKKVPPS